jgi:glycosyltransferase involved in cell wall biosynthesis
MVSESQVLIISHSFPPDEQIGGKRIARWCRYLPGFGIRPVVLTADEQSYTLHDYSFSVPAGIRLERTPMMRTPLDYYKALKTYFRLGSIPITRTSGDDDLEKTSESEVQKTSRGLFRYHLRTLLETPDRSWGWYLPAIRAAERLIEREPIAALISSAPPWTSHLIARHLKKKYNIPWIIDFRDSWAWDPWRSIFLPRWRDYIDRRLEASCLRSADLVVCVTEFIREDFLQHYRNLNSTKFVTLTNGYDDSEDPHQVTEEVVSSTEAVSQLDNRDPPLVIQNNATRLLVHLGDLYGGRRIDTFCEAVTQLTKSGKLDARSIEIGFWGNLNSSISAAACQRVPDLILNKHILFHPRVSWQQAQQVLQNADLLLIFQGNHPGVPAKFYEYLQSGKPMLAIVREGPLSDLVDATGSGLWADPDDPADIAIKLLRALALPVRSARDVRLLTKQYQCRSLAERLAGWINDLTAVPHARGTNY